MDFAVIGSPSHFSTLFMNFRTIFKDFSDDCLMDFRCSFTTSIQYVGEPGHAQTPPCAVFSRISRFDASTIFFVFLPILDAASLHPSNILENLHMLKHCPAQCFQGFPGSTLRRCFCFVPNFLCRRALKNRLCLWTDFPFVLLPKIYENDFKIHEKNVQKAFQN